MKNRSIAILILCAFISLIGIGNLFQWLDERTKEAERQALNDLNSGIALFQQKKYDEALVIFERIPAGIIHDWHLPYYTASSHVMLKDYRSAVGKYEDALELNPGEPLILFALGVTYFKLNNIGLSKSYFAAALELDPGNEEAKGLMDIMARLEREQSGEAQSDEIRSAKSAH